MHYSQTCGERKGCIVVVVFFVLLNVQLCWAQTGDWKKQLDSTGDASAQVMSVGPSGIVTAGIMNRTASERSSSGEVAFLRRYHSSGRLLWERQFERATTKVTGLYTTGKDAVLTGLIKVQGKTKGIIRKYDMKGNLRWERQVLGQKDSSVEVVAVVGNNEGLYIAGWASQQLSDAMDCQDSSVVNESCQSFLRKYDQTGNTLWTKMYETKGPHDRISSIVADETGVYVSRNYWSEVEEDFNTVLQKVSTVGKTEWIYTLTDVAPIYGTQVTELRLYEAEGLYVVGHRSDIDTFLLKIDPRNGDILLAKAFSSKNGEIKMAIVSSGIYLVGNTKYTFGGTTSGKSLSVTYLSHEGETLRETKISTEGYDDTFAISVSGSGFYITDLPDCVFLAEQGNSAVTDAFLLKVDAGKENEQ